MFYATVGKYLISISVCRFLAQLTVSQVDPLAHVSGPLLRSFRMSIYAFSIGVLSSLKPQISSTATPAIHTTYDGNRCLTQVLDRCWGCRG